MLIILSAVLSFSLAATQTPRPPVEVSPNGPAQTSTQQSFDQGPVLQFPVRESSTNDNNVTGPATQPSSTGELPESINARLHLVQVCPEVARDCQVPTGQVAQVPDLQRALDCMLQVDLDEIEPGPCWDAIHLLQGGGEDNATETGSDDYDYDYDYETVIIQGSQSNQNQLNPLLAMRVMQQMQQQQLMQQMQQQQLMQQMMMQRQQYMQPQQQNYMQSQQQNYMQPQQNYMRQQPQQQNYMPPQQQQNSNAMMMLLRQQQQQAYMQQLQQQQQQQQAAQKQQMMQAMQMQTMQQQPQSSSSRSIYFQMQPQRSQSFNMRPQTSMHSSFPHPPFAYPSRSSRAEQASQTIAKLLAMILEAIIPDDYDYSDSIYESDVHVPSRSSQDIDQSNYEQSSEGNEQSSEGNEESIELPPQRSHVAPWRMTPPQRQQQQQPIDASAQGSQNVGQQAPQRGGVEVVPPQRSGDNKRQQVSNNDDVVTYRTLG